MFFNTAFRWEWLGTGDARAHLRAGIQHTLRARLDAAIAELCWVADSEGIVSPELRWLANVLLISRLFQRARTGSEAVDVAEAERRARIAAAALGMGDDLFRTGCRPPGGDAIHRRLARGYVKVKYGSEINRHAQFAIDTTLGSDKAANARNRTAAALILVHGTCQGRQPDGSHLRRAVDQINAYCEIIRQPEQQVRLLIVLRSVCIWQKDFVAFGQTFDRIMQIRDANAACELLRNLAALTKEQAAAIRDWSSMQQYVRALECRLRAGVSLRIRDELELMVRTVRGLMLSSRIDPVLGMMLARVEWYLGNLNQAHDWLIRVVNADRSPKNLGITWLLVAEVRRVQGRYPEALEALAASYEFGARKPVVMFRRAEMLFESGQHDQALQILDSIGPELDVKPARTQRLRAQVLLALNEREPQRARENRALELLWDASRKAPSDIRIRSLLLGMIARPRLVDLGVDCITATTDTRELDQLAGLAEQAVLPDRRWFSAAMMRLRLPTTPHRIGQGLVQVARAFVMRAYFDDEHRTSEYWQLLERICGVIRAASHGRARAWLLELLAARQHQFLTELLMRYEAKVRGRIEAAKATAGARRREKIVDVLNRLLRAEFLPDMCPVNYGGWAAQTLDEITTLTLFDRDLVARENFSHEFRMAPTVDAVAWHWIKPLVSVFFASGSRLLKALDQPGVDWTLHVLIDGTSVMLEFEPATRDWLQVRQVVEQWQEGPPLRLHVEVIAPQIGTGLKVRLGLPAPQPSLPGAERLKAWQEHVGQALRSVLIRGEITPDYYDRSDELFPEAPWLLGDATWWAQWTWCMADIRVATVLEWLVGDSGGGAPYAALHDMKNAIAFCPEDEIDLCIDTGFERLRLLISQRMFLQSMPVVDLGATVQKLVREFPAAGLAIDVSAASQVYVEIRPEFIESILSHLLHNAQRAVADPRLAPALRRVIVKVIAAESPGGNMPPVGRLQVVNARVESDREALHGGSGRGLELVAELLKLAGGHLMVDDTRPAVFEVAVELRLVKN